MSADFAETAAVADPRGPLSGAGELALPPPRPLERLRADAGRLAALREVWRALWLSRLVVWLAGAGTVAMFGFGPVRRAFDPPGATRGFGRLGDVLAAPVARWDAAWYLTIAHYGYRPDLGAFTASRTAFFPLYPLGLRAVSDLGAPPVLAGVLVSLAALAASLYALHRLTTLEVARLRLPGGERVARLAVLSCALAPMAFYFSAVYSESLYMALSLGVFLCARRGRWPAAAGLAALAGATRSTGIVLALPLALLYLYGPREDRPPDRAGAGGALAGGWTHSLAASPSALASVLRPRYRIRRDALWIALVPVGVLLYMAHLALNGGDALSPFHAQAAWSRHFAGPYGGVWDGLKAGVEGIGRLTNSAGHNLELLVFLLLGMVALVGVLRMLPFAYGAYVLGALALPLSYPVSSQPLMSLPRFLLVLFPLNIWLAARLAPRPRLASALLGCSALALAFFSAAFSTWHWVA